MLLPVQRDFTQQSVTTQHFIGLLILDSVNIHIYKEFNCRWQGKDFPVGTSCCPIRYPTNAQLSMQSFQPIEILQHYHSFLCFVPESLWRSEKHFGCPFVWSIWHTDISLSIWYPSKTMPSCRRPEQREPSTNFLFFSFLVGILFTMLVFGPACGFILGSFCTKIYVDAVFIDTSKKNWILFKIKCFNVSACQKHWCLQVWAASHSFLRVPCMHGYHF